MREAQKREAEPGRYHCEQDAPVTLRTVAKRLNLSPTTVSLILNDVPNFAFPEETRRRVIATARTLGYSPNGLARSLRNGATMRMVGIMLPGISEICYAKITGGIGSRLAESGYCYMIADHGYSCDMAARQIREFSSRGAQGIILIDAEAGENTQLPVVTVSCRNDCGGTAQIKFNRDRAVILAMEYFLSRGHQRILLVREGCDDAHFRAVQEIAASFHLEVAIAASRIRNNKHVILWHHHRNFGVLTFDPDRAVMVARDLDDWERHPNSSVAVVCIDSQGRAGTDSAITIIRQPLKTTGEVAAESLLWKIGQRNYAVSTIRVRPEIVGTCPASATSQSNDLTQLSSAEGRRSCNGN